MRRFNVVRFTAALLCAMLLATAAHAQRYQVRAYNADDIVTIYLNGKPIAQAHYMGDSGLVDLPLASGGNLVEFQLINLGGPAAWGYQLVRDGVIIVSDSCGIAGGPNTGCNNNASYPVGEIFRRQFHISGASVINVEADTDRPAANLTPLVNTTRDACIQACMSDPACMAFTHIEIPTVYDYQYCWMKTFVPAPVARVGVVSGVKVLPPAIASFTAIPQTIRAGQSATLSWGTQGATSVSIDQGVGTQALSGSATVSPNTTTTYILSATGAMGTSSMAATVNVLTAPNVVASSIPAAMIQAPDSGGATAAYTLTNAGGTATTIQLSRVGIFFTQSPASFPLAPGASQVVAITAVAQPAGAYEGASIPSGSGVPAGLQIPVKLLSAAPLGPVQATPTTNRVDVASDPTVPASGSVSFANSGSATLTGILTSDSPWLVPQSGMVTIPAGATASFAFTIDRTKRPDAAALIGSATGRISLTYPSGSAPAGASPLDVGTTPSVSVVTVVDTVRVTVANATPPALGAGELALFVPGVGHVLGTVGLFVSDVAILNSVSSSRLVSDLRLYYAPVGGVTSPQQAVFPAIGSVGVNVADIVRNVFGNDGQVGSLQVRSKDVANVLVSANVFNSSNPEGTYGTAIPTFRSDRAIASGGRLFLTGLRRDGTSHTNLFIQETSGVGVTVQTEFLAADGTSLGTRTDQVAPFALTQINNVVPQSAVSAILTNVTSSGAAAFLAYATPVDEASGDNWSVADWSRQYGYAGSEPIVIPIGGAVHGALNTYFQTDIAIMNTGSTQASGTLRYLSRTGDVFDQQISLAPRQSRILSSVVSTLFGLTTDTVGDFLFTPATGNFAVTSRIYTTVAGKAGTYGTGVPSIAVSGALRAGAVRPIGSLEDSSTATISAARPATFRTNFGIVEVGGSPTLVRVTLRFSYPAGSLVQGVGSASKDYLLNPSQFLLLSGIASEILGANNRSSLGDLQNLEADFQVIGGTGAVVVFTSSVDNGTGDSILRTE